MIQLGAPGVYIVEAPSGLRPITAVATSIAAFVDFFPEGPTDQAVQIFGLTDYQRYFGAVDSRSEASYAISQFFLNGGASAWVCRVVGTGSATATAVANAVGGTALFTASAASPGSWGNNVRFSISPNSDASFDFDVTRYDGSSGSAKPIANESFVGLNANTTDPDYFYDAVNDGSALLQLSGIATPASGTTWLNPPQPNGTISDTISDAHGDTAAFLAGLTSPLNFAVKIGNSDSRQVTITWPSASLAALPTDIRSFRALLESAIQTATGNPTYDQAFTGSSLSLVKMPPPPGASPPPLPTLHFLLLSNSRAKTYSPTELVTVTNGASGTSGDQLKFTSGAFANVQEYVPGVTPAVAALGAGTLGADGGLPNAQALIGNTVPTLSGMHLLDKVDLFNLLLIPAMANLDTPTGNSTTPANNQGFLVSNALAYCESRRAMLFVDIPKNIDTPQKVQDWLDTNDGFRDNNSVIYFPRLEIPDVVNNLRLRSVGPSGTLAGIYARTDGQRGVWKAPAGIDATLNGVTQLDYKMTDAENGVLNPLGINCLRVFPVYGEIAWGARTLEGADVIGSQWKYIPIRRLALMIEESLFRGTKWVVFEPNDEPLWAKIRQNVGAFMLGLFRQGAFQGGSASEAFFVKCDSETTTANDRQLGIVNIQVGFAPLKPAEFVVITISQIPDQT